MRIGGGRMARRAVCMIGSSVILALGTAASLADDPTETGTPSTPQWVCDLLPHTGEPDPFLHRLRRVETAPLEHGVRVQVEFLYRDVHGATQTAAAKLYLPNALRDSPGAKCPLVHSAGYELDDGGADGLMRDGCVVVTPRMESADPLVFNPMTRGPNLDIALLHAARALPFVDGSRVRIQGGSAGGYTTLMLAAETFPLVCAMPDVPPVNWGYNAAFFFENQQFARRTPPGSDVPAMPVMAMVSALADAGAPVMGRDGDGDSYAQSSPIAHLATITAPTQITFSTADMLVPVDQVGTMFVRPRDARLFPPGYTTSPQRLMRQSSHRRTLLQALPAKRREVFMIPVPAGAPDLTEPSEAGKPAASLPAPFSKDRTFSIIVVDEGPQTPAVGHFRYAVGLDRHAFIEWATGRGPDPRQLTAEKLGRLMMRFLGEEYRPFSVADAAGQPQPGVRLDFQEAERADVLLGLRAFAEEGVCAERLAELYEGLPERLKALGSSLGSGDGESVRRTLSSVQR